MLLSLITSVEVCCVLGVVRAICKSSLRHPKKHLHITLIKRFFLFIHTNHIRGNGFLFVLQLNNLLFYRVFTNHTICHYFFVLTNSVTAIDCLTFNSRVPPRVRSEEHTSELQSRPHLVCRLLLEKKKKKKKI